MAVALPFAHSSLALSASRCIGSFSSPFIYATPSRSVIRLRVRAGPDLLGDFGARDPFPEELASNFGEKVLGATDTMHRILIPSLSALSLSRLPLHSVDAVQALPAEDAQRLLKKIVGWRLVEIDSVVRLQCSWKVNDKKCGEELVSRIQKALDGSSHYPELHIENSNKVTAELWTTSVGGLSMNDFIVAARIDQVKVVDLIPKKRIWA